MKKRSLALLGIAALATLSLASCKDNKKPGTTTTGGDTPKPTDTGSGETGSSQAATGTDAYYTAGDNSSGVCKWAPMSFADAKKKYVDKNGDPIGGQIDAWIVYSKSYGTTYNNVLGDKSTTNPIDHQTYTEGDTLPAWKAFAEKLGLTKITQGAAYGADDANNYTNFQGAKKDSTTGLYADRNGQIVDVFYNTTANLNELGDNGEVLDLTPYLNKMPAFSKFLEDNPEVRQELDHNGKIFYTPYMDGYQAIERNFVMDTTQVAKLLDEDLPTGTGALVAGASAAADSKGLKGAPSAEPFMGKDGKNYDQALKIKIVNPKDTTKTAEVTVKQTDNIITLQNAALAKTDGSTTGKTLIDQFKKYAKEAYGDIIDNYYDGKISKMFTSVGACYNADDLVALLRIFKANPDVLYGSKDVYDEVVPVFPRGQANNRVENILNFGATLYGVQGRGSEYDHLFFGADGTIHDFDTAQASYDMLDKLHNLYSEGLIQANFWAGSAGTAGIDKFFKHSLDESTFGLLEYDYTATQSAANDLANGIGTASTSRKTSKSGFDFSTISVTGVNCILSPLTYVSTDSFTYAQNLDDRTGKTIARYYEENRAVKNTSWSIPSKSDNINSAIALMDFMFTKEGWEIQNFGPSTYWDYATILGEANTPKLKQTLLDHFAQCSLDFWNYCRGFLGTTQGIGHYRPSTLDFQATNANAQDSYSALTFAANLGVQMTSRAIAKKEDISWHASMPMAVFSKMNAEVAKTYAGVTTFWSQAGKATKDGSMVGWVKVVADGKDTTDNVLTGVEGKDYKYSDILAERVTKNTTYLAEMGKKMNIAAPETKKA